MDWLAVVQQYINIKAVLIAVIGTQFIKYLLPSAVPEPKTTWERFTVRSGAVITRVVPFIPVILAFVATFFIERDSKYTMEDAVHGISSGAFAGYSYRTTKTMIFGE